MRRPDCYRYLLAVLPPHWFRREIATLHRLTSQPQGWVPIECAHLSLCVLAAPKERDHSLAPRIDAALAGAAFSSCVIRFGRIRGGSEGAALFTRGCKTELTSLRRALLGRLAAHGVFPQQEKKNPHVTLGYDRWSGGGFDIDLERIPRHIVPIESEHGCGKHNQLGRWPLLAPRQDDLEFMKWCRKRTRIRKITL
jgi:2'-5' RNA ligase